MTNRQPIFTSTVILEVQTFDPALATNNYDIGNFTPTLVHYGNLNGELIERITVSACGDLTNPYVSAKLVYLYISDYNTGLWNLYKVGTIPETTVTSNTPNPEIVWTFDGGLTLGITSRNALGIAASINFGTYNRYADYLSVTVEGSEYIV